MKIKVLSGEFALDVILSNLLVTKGMCLFVLREGRLFSITQILWFLKLRLKRPFLKQRF